MQLPHRPLMSVLSGPWRRKQAEIKPRRAPVDCGSGGFSWLPSSIPFIVTATTYFKKPSALYKTLRRQFLGKSEETAVSRCPGSSLTSGIFDQGRGIQLHSRITHREILSDRRRARHSRERSRLEAEMRNAPA